MIVADTGAIVALIDSDDRHHSTLSALFEEDPETWLLPWAILPELDYLVGKFMGSHAEEAFLFDLSRGLYQVVWGEAIDFQRANELVLRYRDLKLGLVDSIVMAVAERIKAHTIATIDERHFAAVAIRGEPRLVPRDLT